MASKAYDARRQAGWHLLIKCNAASTQTAELAHTAALAIGANLVWLDLCSILNADWNGLPPDTWWTECLRIQYLALTGVHPCARQGDRVSNIQEALRLLPAHDIQVSDPAFLHALDIFGIQNK